MTAGGWGLIHVWLSDGIQYQNYALIEELLELLLLCPVNVERLKSNNCPKLIKGLSKNSHMGVRTLASRLVEQWLKMVKAEAPLNTSQATESPSSSQSSVSEVQSYNSHASVGSSINQISEHTSSIHLSDPSNDSQCHLIQSVGVQQQLKNSSPKFPSQSSNHIQSQSGLKSASPVCKITIRDGNQVLSQMQTDASNINLSGNVNISSTDVNGIVSDNTVSAENKGQKSDEEGDNNFERLNHNEASKNIPTEVSQVTIKVDFDSDVDMIDAVNKDQKDEKHENNKSISNKENRDKKEDKKSASSSSSSDKKSSSSSRSSSKHSSSSSKHSSSKHSSSSQRSSSKSSSSSKDKSSRDKEKDKHHSSSSSKSSSSKSKSDKDKDRDKDKDKEKVKKDQAEKDKATLEKLQSQTLSTKMMKIPKKKADEEKAGESPSRKSSTDSKDSYKENKDKKVNSVPEKKSISMSIESRKNTQDMSRPKTVKTFNSKFRSTGLEEEVKPPLPRGTKKVSSLPEKKVLPPKLSLKRSSPTRDSGSSVEKKPRLSLDSPTTPPNDEKKGGIKLIAAKPKCKYISLKNFFRFII